MSSQLPPEHVHSVQFYGDDGVLLHELESYIGKALAAGNSTVIIATPGHIDGLARKLTGQGIDLGKAKAEGRYVAMDAAKVLSEFMVNGRPDRGRFSEMMGRTIACAAQASDDENRRVVAFGEMVALLWAEGHSEAAIELEKLWNELGRTYSFSLHCGYPMQGFCREELADSLRKICGEHTRVVQNETFGSVGSGSVGSEDKRLRKAPDVAQPRPILPGVEWHEWEEPFRLFIESVQDYAIFMLDADGVVVTWNAGAERAKGYRAAEIIGKDFSIFYSEEDVRAGKPQRLLGLAAKEGRVEDEGWRVRKDGSKFWANVTLTAIKDATGKLIGFGKLTRDLTESRRTELALRRTEERYRLFIEAVQDYAIFLLDPEGNVSTWNTGAERIKGYKANEIIGQHFSRFYPEEDVRSGKPAWELEVATKEGRFEDEGWRLRKDGSKFWANVIITPVKDSMGGLLGFSKVTRDVTERMLAKKSLEESQRKLQSSERSLRDLSFHLLRTQDEERRRIGREIHDSLGQYLSVLKMKLDAMSASPPTTEESAECAKLVDACVKEVRTISYLLYPPMLEEMGLTSAIPWYLEGFSDRSGIQTLFHAPQNFGRLSRDAELVLFRVLQESLTNVQRHSGSNTAEIVISKEENLVTLQVTDKGKGLPGAILEKSGRDWMGSLGVGLRGMSERLRQLGGTLDVLSDENGTQVRATVPSGKLTSTTASSTSTTSV
jgi:PAS domain S-box-containing protein